MTYALLFISVCRFVSATNIDDYSSGDSSLMDDIVKVPRMQRRNAMVTASSNSMCGSEVDLTASVGNNYAHAAPLLNYNRAVSCSDLVLEFSDREQSVSGMHNVYHQRSSNTDHCQVVLSRHACNPRCRPANHLCIMACGQDFGFKMFSRHLRFGLSFIHTVTHTLTAHAQHMHAQLPCKHWLASIYTHMHA